MSFSLMSGCPRSTASSWAMSCAGSPRPRLSSSLRPLRNTRFVPSRSERATTCSNRYLAHAWVPPSGVHSGARLISRIRRTTTRSPRSRSRQPGRTRFIPREQVRWVEAEGDYVRLHTTDGSAYLLRMPISHLEERWSAYGFIRIHRGFLVQFKHITEFSVTNGVHAVTVAGHSLPVSRRHVRDVRDRILRAGRRGLPLVRAPALRDRARRRSRAQAGSALSGGPIRYLSSTTFPD